MIVLGVDPGTRTTGYGVVFRAEGNDPSLVECGAIRSATQAPLAERLLEIFEGISEVIERTRPDVLCVEGVFYSRSVRTPVILGHARGAVMLAAAVRGIPVAEYPPAEVKSAVVGSGRAAKDQVAFMVQKHLSLAEPPQPSDAADGVAVALCHLFRSRALEGMR
jgi:crossover junction endodeoxyribonuclease RuvC